MYIQRKVWQKKNLIKKFCMKKRKKMDHAVPGAGVSAGLPRRPTTGAGGERRASRCWPPWSRGRRERKGKGKGAAPWSRRDLAVGSRWRRKSEGKRRGGREINVAWTPRTWVKSTAGREVTVRCNFSIGSLFLRKKHLNS